jgi:small subunit ribosomal protein S6
MSQCYEIMLIVRPDQSDQAPEMIERYKAMIIASGGQVDRAEDWGRRSLSYAIKLEEGCIKKAHYVLLNVRLTPTGLKELEEHFKFNDAIIRRLLIRVKHVITEPTGLCDKDKVEKMGKRGFVREELKNVDYKDIHILKRHILETGSMIPSRISGTTAMEQRRLSHAIKVARFLALLPYCDWHR